MTDSWVRGDYFGLDMPALRSGGPQFLTDAFRASGALASDCAVTAAAALAARRTVGRLRRRRPTD